MQFLIMETQFFCKEQNLFQKLLFYFVPWNHDPLLLQYHLTEFDDQ